jgi:hypothetical protein
MKHGNAFFLLPFIFALSLLAALMITGSVFAQDELPPESPTPTEIIPEVEEIQIAEPAPGEVSPPEAASDLLSIPVEEPAVDATVPGEDAVEVPVEETSAEDLAPVLEAVADAGLTLVNETGEPLALSTEQAAQTLSTGDPYYTTAAGKYMFVLSPATCPGTLPAGTVYCAASATPIQAAVNYISTSGLPSDGMIYIEGGNYTENISVDASTEDILKGLKGLIGEVVDFDPKVKLAGNIWINEVDLGFKIKGFNLDDGHLVIANSLGTITVEDSIILNPGGDLGIHISAGGPVILNRVKADYNAEGGALIKSTSNVTITNSSFDRNDPDYGEMVGGLKISANGVVLLDGVSASHNAGNLAGVSISRASSITIKNSIFSNNSTTCGLSYSYFGDAPSPNITLTNVYLNGNRVGLSLYAKGNISLTGVHADGNSYYGAELDTCNQSGGICTWAGTGVVTIKDSSFDENGYGYADSFGLKITSRGAITLTNVSASENIHATGNPAGALLYAHYSPLMNKVTVTNSQFNGNDRSGLTISTKGSVILTKVQSNDNSYGAGLDIDNCLWDGTKCAGSGTVTITGSAPGDNQFNGNQYNGIRIQSKGAISLKYVDSYLIALLDAAYLINDFTGATAGVTVTSSTFGKQSYVNGGPGLVIHTNGSVTLTGITASYNQGGAGVEITTQGTTATVTVKDADMGLNEGHGLSIIGKGTITVTNLTANKNLLSGSRLDNHTGSGAVNLTNATFLNNEGVDPYGGLIIQTKGLVTLKGVTSNQNFGYGIQIENTGGVSGANVTNATLWNNVFTGIKITTNGTVTLSSVTSTVNNGVGAKGAVINNAGTLASSVTITNGTFEDNYTTGFEIISKGNITLTNVSSILNDSTAGSNGATLDNSAGLGYIKITNQASTDSDLKPGFDNNEGLGLEIFTNGLVTLTNVNLMGNAAEGVRVWQELNKGVTLTSCRLDGNNIDSGTAAIMIDTIGTVLINGGYSNNNNVANGLRVDNSHALDSLAKPVTISNFQTNENEGYGIYVLSKGAISLTNVEAHENSIGTAGILLDNQLLFAGITLSNVISKNNVIGMDIRTNGALTYKSGDVSNNTGNGIQLNSPGTAQAKVVTLSNLHIWGNTGYGMLIDNKGSVTITNVTAGGSVTSFGLWIDNRNCTTATPCPVSILTSGSGINKFSYNKLNGLYITTYGAVILNKIDAIDNEGSGVYVENRMVTIPANITVTGGRFNLNDSSGLHLWSKGVISVNGIEVNENGTIFSDFGAFIRNSDDITGTKGVTVTRSTFNGNTTMGLGIQSRGAVVLNTIQALENTTEYGVYVDNRDINFKRPVTLLATYGTNNFNANKLTNLVINSYGIVSLAKVNADSSVNGKGIEIYSYGSGNPVILNSVSSRYNAQDGIYIESYANVTLTSVTSMFNGQGTGSFAGIYIITNEHPSAKVTFTNGLVSGNLDHGIRLDLGPTKLYTFTGVFYFGNNFDGFNGEVNLLVE